MSENSSALYDQLNLVAQGHLGAANETASVQNLAQNAFPEPSTTGLQSQLSQLWTDLSTLATEPGSNAAAQTVVQDASNVAYDAQRLVLPAVGPRHPALERPRRDRARTTAATSARRTSSSTRSRR